MKVRKWLVDQCPGWVVVFASGAVGAVVAIAIFGVGYLSGTSDFWSWPAGDAAMMLTGWEYYAHEPWHWPLAQTFGTNGDRGTNILFLDAIPLVAFAGKIVRGVVGGRWHPYGVWHLAIYVLQAVLAAVLARRLGLKSLLAGLGVAMLSVSTFAFVCRFYHEGLNAHFVLLWALLAYLATERSRSALRIGGGWIACVGCAVLMHPYLGVMTSALAFAALLRLAAQDRRRAAQAAGVSAAGITLLLFAFGYVQKVPRDYGDFGLASMNLMSLVVPYRSALMPVLAVSQDATGLQWDGCNYLGLGVLALLVIALVNARPAVRALLGRHKALVCVLALLALFAPSNHWWFGQRSILHYEIPRALTPLLNNLRASGRFFWPVGYALLIAVCVVVHRRFRRHGAIVIFLAGCVQLADSTSSWSIITGVFARPAPRQLDWNVWARELEGASKVNMYPSSLCWSRTLGIHLPVYDEEREIEFLAASRGARTNAGFIGRPIIDCIREQGEGAAASRGELREGELYVFFKPRYSAEVLHAGIGESRCKEIADAFVCR